MPTTAENGFLPGAARRYPSTSSTCARPTTPRAPCSTPSSSRCGSTTPTSTDADHHVRCRLRALHHRGRHARTPSTRSPAPRPAPSSSASFSKTAGFTGAPLRLHRGAQGARARGPEPERNVEPPPDHQVQRRVLRHPAWRGCYLHRAGREAGRRDASTTTATMPA